MYHIFTPLNDLRGVCCMSIDMPGETACQVHIGRSFRLWRSSRSSGTIKTLSYACIITYRRRWFIYCLGIESRMRREQRTFQPKDKARLARTENSQERQMPSMPTLQISASIFMNGPDGLDGRLPDSGPHDTVAFGISSFHAFWIILRLVCSRYGRVQENKIYLNKEPAGMGIPAVSPYSI